MYIYFIFKNYALKLREIKEKNVKTAIVERNKGEKCKNCNSYLHLFSK